MSVRIPSPGRTAADNEPVDPRAPATPPVLDVPALYERYRTVMFRVAVAGLRAAGRSTLDALDIVHDTFTSIMNSPPDGAVDSWEGLLVTATARKVMDRLKSADSRHSQLMPPGEDGQPQSVEPPPAEDIAEVVVRRMQAAGARARLLSILDGMTARQQQVIRQRVFEQKPVTVIAAELGTTPANVSQLLKNALGHITQALTELDEVDPVDVARLRPARRRGGDA